MDIFRWSDWEQAPNKTAAEVALVEASAIGAPCNLSGQRPTVQTPDVQIRAELLRYLVLGGCAAFPVHVRGVHLSGAWIIGALDLDFAEAKGATRLRFCTFDQQFSALQANMQLLDLTGSLTQGLKAGGLGLRGSLHLKTGFVAKGSVDLAGAQIGGQFHAEGGAFEASRGMAIDARALRVVGSVYLSSGFVALREVDFGNAQIGGTVDCDGGRFEWSGDKALGFTRAQIGSSLMLREGTEVRGELRLVGAHIAGNLTLIGATLGGDATYALNGARMRVGQVLFLKRVTWAGGRLALNEVQCAALSDDAGSWPLDSERLDIDGLVYDRITDGVTSYKGRRAWLLAAGRGGAEFRPQPYVRCAQVLREMGHERDARQVLIAARSDAQRHEDWEMLSRAKGPLGLAISLPYWVIRRFWSHSQRLTVGYGFAPWRSITVLLVLIVVATSLAHQAYRSGAMAPNSGPVLLSEGWRVASEDPKVANPAGYWSCDARWTEGRPCLQAGRDWESFNRYAYAFDVVVPVLSLGQTDAWAPSTSRGEGPWGWILWWARWMLSGLGWLVTALAAAAVTGIIRND